eukprot:12213310-Karenia_brevis.AAC.1
MNVPALAITFGYIPIQLFTWSTIWQADSQFLKMKGFLQVEMLDWISGHGRASESTKCSHASRWLVKSLEHLVPR